MYFIVIILYRFTLTGGRSLLTGPIRLQGQSEVTGYLLKTKIKKQKCCWHTFDRCVCPCSEVLSDVPSASRWISRVDLLMLLKMKLGFLIKTVCEGICLNIKVSEICFNCHKCWNYWKKTQNKVYKETRHLVCTKQMNLRR